MAEQPQSNMQRRLAAILSADAVGYSRLMGGDDVATVRTLSTCRAIIAEIVASFGGRVVDSPGDNILAEFPSAVDAVKSASAIQIKLGAANADLSEDRRMAFRIGVNLGDVLVENGRLYGDGVNVAARMESQAEPGGICVSGKIYEEVAGKLDLSFHDMGEQTVKNIAKPVRVYRVTSAVDAAKSAPAAPPARATLALPDKPSIAVLAFQNMSGDPEQEYFSDGLSEDIITDLSKISELHVIARNSSFTYKGKPVDVKLVGRELGVRYVLEGSVRKAGNRVRITGQLIDATSDAHVWADRFDRDLTDIFAVQDEVTRNIVDALKIKLTPAEAAKLGAEGEAAKGKAHDFYMLGRETLFGAIKSREVFDRTTDLFEQAISEDPGYGPPYAGMAMAFGLNWQNHWTDDWSQGLDKAMEYAGLALRKSPQVAFVHYVAALTYMFKRDLDRCAAEADAALAINPNFALAYNARSLPFLYGGEPLAAVPHIEQAMRLDPLYAHQYRHFLGTAYLVAGQYDTALAHFRERIRLAPKTDLSRAFLASVLGHLGQAEEAKRVWAELMAINPKYSFAEHVGRLPFRNQADIDGLFAGLKKAGIDA